jgi:hypothetical protein
MLGTLLNPFIGMKPKPGGAFPTPGPGNGAVGLLLLDPAPLLVGNEDDMATKACIQRLSRYPRDYMTTQRGAGGDIVDFGIETVELWPRTHFKQHTRTGLCVAGRTFSFAHICPQRGISPILARPPVTAHQRKLCT